MTEDLAQISRLQALEQRIVEIHTEIKSLPKQVAELEKLIEAHQRKLEAEKATLGANQRERREKELEVQTHTQKVAKLREQMNSAKTNEQFRAFQNEIDFAEKEIKNAEEQIGMLNAAARPLEEAVKGAEAEVAEERRVIEAKKKEAEERTAVFKTDFDGRMAERKRMLRALTPSMLKSYERMRKKYPVGLILVEAVEGRCKGCQMMLRPQLFQDLKQGDQVIHCESCGRFLYWNPPINAVNMSTPAF
jgi:predicted  nucleic acid-binding Zn-ribbon protein